jgi:hypothetical protein
MLACSCLTLILSAQAIRAEQPMCEGSRAAEAPAAASQPHGPCSAIAAASLGDEDPLQFFLSVANRYRRLYTYRDTVNLVQVTRRVGEEPTRVETKLTCEVSGGDLRVATPATQVRHAAGLNVPTQKSEDQKQRDQDYATWLAPHMKLKFADKPLEDFRAGVDEGFTATEAHAVVIDEKPKVHLELRSGDGQSESCTARFDLYIDSQSLLIERIEGRQRMPDGSELETTVEIDPDESGITNLPEQADPVS